MGVLRHVLHGKISTDLLQYVPGLIKLPVNTPWERAFFIPLMKRGPWNFPINLSANKRRRLYD